MLSAEQNGSQSEEINVIDESQAEDRPVPMQEAEIRCQISFILWFAVLSGLSKDSPRSPLTIPVR